MNKIEIKLATGNRYLNELKDECGNPIKFELPNGVLNKELTGCGGTTLALEDEYKTIICSPRKELLMNKFEQYPNCLLVMGGIYKEEIKEYLANTVLPKILVTYDSLYKLIECIKDISSWRIVVDEFQCLLNDSTFKSETEMKLLNNLKKFPYVTYMSATPILDKYLEQLEYFNDIPYYCLNWTDKYKVQVYREQTSNPIGAAIEIVKAFKDGNYPRLMDEDITVESKEAVIFLNSVQNIINIIKQTELEPEQVNIIVGQDEENDALIAKLGKGFTRGKAPLRGESHKLITFCTSTAYAGVDFYSTCASTFVISDCKRPNTSVDIATELAQIAGRQRLDSNPFRYYLQFFYNTNVEGISEEAFEQALSLKELVTKQEVEYNNNAPKELRETLIKRNKKSRMTIKYEDSYTMYDETVGKFVFNRLAYISDRYAYDVQQYNYQNGLLVRSQLENTGVFDVSEPERVWVFKEHIKNTISRKSFIERMKYYCDYRSKGGMTMDFLAEDLVKKSPAIKVYYNELGADRIKALSYRESNLKDEIRNKESKGNIAYELSKRITTGFISNAELKDIIQSVYDKLQLKKKAKATDIELLLDCKEGRPRIDGKQVRGYQINSIKIITK